MKQHLEDLSKTHHGPGTKYRWTGKMMGFEMDFKCCAIECPFSLQDGIEILKLRY